MCSANLFLLFLENSHQEGGVEVAQVEARASNGRGLPVLFPRWVSYATPVFPQDYLKAMQEKTMACCSVLPFFISALLSVLFNALQ